MRVQRRVQCSKEDYRNANLLQEARQLRVHDYNLYLEDEKLIQRNKHFCTLQNYSDDITIFALILVRFFIFFAKSSWIGVKIILKYCGMEWGGVAKEDKDNSVILAKQLEDKLVADCATLEGQEVARFNAEVNNSI